MCTVTYISQGKGKFILTSNRDEAATRSPQNISRIVQDDLEIIFPRDNQAGGSWIAASQNDKMVCLLNGAFERHARKPSYKRSRGIMLLDFFKFETAKDFINTYDFEGMESFTKIIYDQGALFEIRWDEQKFYVKELNPNGYYLWSSATLYDSKARKRRKQWFQNWLKDRNDFSLDAINHFHKNGGRWDTWNGFIMNRCDLVQTVSITNIIKTDEGMTMRYNDLLRKQIKEEKVNTLSFMNNKELAEIHC